MTKILLAEKERCTGCGVCATVCPTNSIEMVQDNEGFCFPKIKGSCIECGKCVKTCPILTKKEKKENIEQKVCIAIYKDREVWQKSTSGGAFTAICNIFGDDKTVVFGAVFDADKKQVRHEWIEGVENIEKFRGSKYSQSVIGDCYSKVKEFLKAGKRVIFSGTPCQISALRGYLGETKNENLLCIDLICHGVGSPKVFEKYLNVIESRKGYIVNYEFRHKIIKCGAHNLYNSKLTYHNGKEKVCKNDVYNNLFLQKIICRKSCDNCEYANTFRVGDLTIGDAKQMYSINPKLPINRNASIVVCNTLIGKSVFDSLPQYMDTYPCTVNDVVKTNHPFSQRTKSSPLREEFFKDFDSQNDVYLYMKRWVKKKSLLQKMRNCIPDKFKERIKNVITKG